jgi:hypothetical protein
MLIFRYKALFGLLFAVILNCETASSFGGGVDGASETIAVCAEVGGCRVVERVLRGWKS